MARVAGWPRRGPLSSLSPRRRWFVLVMVVVVGLIGGAALDGIADEFRPADLAAQDVPGAVVLVPGYGGDVSQMELLALRLTVSGRTAAVVRLPDGGVGDFAAQAGVIDDVVAAQLRRGAPSVDVIAYSAGGVATWLWLLDGRTAPAARRIVTIGSPLRGAELAAAGSALAPDQCPQACRELAPGSALLTRLAAAGPPPGVPWLSIWTRSDDVVSPADSARVPGVRDVDIDAVCPVPFPRHARLPTNQLVTGLLLYEIATAPSPPMGPADCSRLVVLGSGRPRLSLN